MNAPTHPSALRTGLALAFLAMSSVTGTAQIVQIKEVISREVSIHVGGVQDPEIREIVSREASLFVLSGPADPYPQVISREVSLANASLAPPKPVADFMVSPSPRGDRVDLDWRSYNGWAAGDILRFDIYWRDRPFTNVAGMTPLKSVSGESTSTTITGLPELRDHFFAVVPVDALTNFNSEVTYSAAYILSPEVISREVSIFVGDEPDPPYAQAISREVSFVVTTPEAPAPITNVVRQVAPD